MTSAYPARSLLSRCGHVVVALALVLPMLVLSGLAAPAEAVGPSCPAAGISVTSLNSPNFYLDSGIAPQLLSGYAGYRVTSTTARSDLWVKLSNFTGGALALNGSQQGRLPIGPVAANGSVPAYFMLTANPAASASFGNVQAHTVEVYSGIPGTSTATVLCSATGSFAKVSETIKAAANKLQVWSGGSSPITVTSSNSTPKLGGTVTVSVEGNTGTIGSGISNDPNGFNMTPSALASFPAGAFRLVSTSLLVSPTGSGAKTTYNDVLHLGLTNGTARDYRTTYVFALTGTTTTGTQLYPVQQIASGTQIKHTDTSSYSAIIPPIAAVANTLTIDLSSNPTSLPDYGGDAVMTQTVNSTTTNSVIVDQLLAEMPADPYVSYRPGTAMYNGVTIPDPDITGQQLAFSGPFPASTSTPGVLTYTLNFPDYPSSWVIKGWGLLGNTYIDTTTATIDVAPAEVVITPTSYTSQTITFPALTDSTISGTQPVPVATASSGLTVTYETTTPAVCTISGTTITVVGAGVCTVRARQEGDGSTAAATPVNRSYTINGDGGTQTITFPALADTSGDQTPPTPAATTTSGLPITYTSSTPSVCTIGEGVIFFTGTGTCTIVASQPGDGSYTAATPISRSFTVTAGSQTITYPALADTAVDQSAPTPAATASSGLPVSYSSSTSSVCTVTSAGVITLVAAGTCTITAAQGGSSTYNAATSVSRSFAVTSVSQSITFPAPLDTAVDDPTAPTMSATASSGLPVSYTSSTTAVCTVTSGGVVTLVSPGTCTITAAQAGNGTYAAATSVPRSFAVSKASQSITFPALADTAVNGTAPTPAATSSSGLSVTYASSTTSVCTVSTAVITLVAPGTCTITASQAGNSNYNAATSLDRSFEVTNAAQTITFPALANTAVDQSAPTPAATASSGLPVSYSSTTTSVCTVTSAGVITLVAPGTCTITAAQGGNSTYGAASSVSRSFEVGQVSQTITFPALTSTAINAAAPTLSATAGSGLPVSYASTTPSVCTVSSGVITLVAAGNCSITASQAGNSTYAAATVSSRSFEVTKVTQTLTFPTPADVTIAAPSPTMGGSATSGLGVNYTTNSPSVCTVSGSTVTLVGTGICSITASQPGDATYAAATPLTRTFSIAPTGPLTLPPASSSTTGTTPHRFTLTGIAPGAVLSIPGSVRTSTPGLASVVVTGTSVTITAKADFSGLMRVPVTVTAGGVATIATVRLVVLPNRPPKASFAPVSADHTKVSWLRSPNAHSYEVSLNGRPVCVTTRLSCNVAGLLGPNSHVRVRSLGGSGTHSTQQTALSRPVRAVKVASVYFATSSALLTGTDRQTLRRVATLMRRQGFGTLALVGHTDSRGTNKSNRALSARRANNTYRFLVAQLAGSGVRFKVTYRSENSPAASNTTKAGRALNRRTDVSLR